MIVEFELAILCWEMSMILLASPVVFCFEIRH